MDNLLRNITLTVIIYLDKAKNNAKGAFAMINNSLKKRNAQSGFTIIEVLIVLAIAGLILLVVFLAVPALQRNAHNTARKSDVASLLGGMTEYISNNNGSLPIAQAAGSGQTYSIGGPTATANKADVKLGNLDASGITIVASVPGGPIPVLADNTAVIYEKATCGGTGGNVPTTSTGSRSFVAYYILEGGAKVCSAS